jgi:hypothetical protein
MPSDLMLRTPIWVHRFSGNLCESHEDILHRHSSGQPYFRPELMPHRPLPFPASFSSPQRPMPPPMRLYALVALLGPLWVPIQAYDNGLAPLPPMVSPARDLEHGPLACNRGSESRMRWRQCLP